MLNPSLFLNVLKNNKIFFFFLLIVILLGNSGCSERAQSQAIRFGLTTEPVTLDPRFATDAVSDRINRLIYARLIDFDQRFQVIPKLAVWEKVSPIHYRFTLQEEYRVFHNGMKLTSADVKASYESVLDQSNASPHRSSLNMIEKIVTPNTNKIDFFLNKADPLFPGRLTLGIMPAELIEANYPFNKKPIGSGPLKFNQWPQGGKLLLERVSDQQSIQFITVKDPTVRALKLVRGELDLFQGDIPQEMFAWVAEQVNVKTETNKGNTFSYLGFNLEDPVVGQLQVRQAIANALNRDDIIKFVFKGAARTADAIFTPEHWVGNPDLQGYHQDQKKAKTLLTELGYDKENPLKITYKTSNDPFRIRLATVIQYQLKQVGIELKIQSYDWGTFYGDIKAGNFQMYSLSWVGLKLPDIFRYIFHTDSIPPEGANRGRFSNVHIDQLISQAELETDQLQQAKRYKKMQALLLEQLPYIPLWYENSLLVQRDHLVNYQLSLDGNYDGLIRVRKNNETH